MDDLAKAMVKKLTQGMAEQNKAMAAAKTDDEKNITVGFPHLPLFFPEVKWTVVLAIFYCIYCLSIFLF